MSIIEIIASILIALEKEIKSTKNLNEGRNHIDHIEWWLTPRCFSFRGEMCVDTFHKTIPQSTSHFPGDSGLRLFSLVYRE